jgi:hypothetical protein
MRALIAVPALLCASVVGAQLPNASPAAAGLGGNFTAIARGYEAVRWNPANLAMPGRPFLSLGLAMLGGTVGMDPVDLKTFTAGKGADVPDATRIAWVDEARLAGGQHIRMDGGVTPIALSVGPIGIQVGNSTYTNMDLSPDAWEAVLFGNAGNNGGQAKDLDFAGTSIRAGTFTTGAVSVALPIPINFTQGILKNERAAIGLTGKYVVGHGVLFAEDNGSVFGGQSITLSFPSLAPIGDDFDPLASTGMGADLSVAWSGGPWRVGFLGENVFNNFKWDTLQFGFRPGTGTIDAANGTTDFEEQPYSGAPQALKDVLTNQTFKPAFALGAAFALTDALTLTADMRRATGGEDAIVFGPRSHFGVGAEWRLLSFLPLRAGVASVSDGWQAGAGFGLRLMGYELGLSTSLRARGSAVASGFMLGVVGIGR